MQKVSGIGSAMYQPKFKIKSQIIYDELRQLFENFATNSHKFSVPASSQANESLNQIITIIFSKNKNYSTSISGDIRVASAVLNKNEGTSYLLKVKERICLPITDTLKQSCKKQDEIRFKKTVKANTFEYKRRRLELKHEREKLKNTMEKSESLTHEKNLVFEVE